MRVAFLGLGRMGAPMAAHLPAAGHDLTVWNRTPGRAASLVAQGAREAASIADAVRGAEAVVTMLFGPDAVREVLAKVAAHAPAGALVVDCSTVGPDVARESAELLRGKGLRYVDAPVAGSIGPATEGTLAVFAGGTPEDYAAAEPLLHLWGDPAKVRHTGPAGSGSAAKLVVNLSLGVVMGAVGEALRLADDLGVDRRTALDVLALGPLGFTVAQKRAMFESGDYRPANFSLALMAKDLGLCAAAAKGELRLTGAARDAARAAVAAGHGDEDYSGLAGWFASGAGQ